MLKQKEPIIVAEPIEYPESDGEPMGETGIHVNLIVDALIHPLKERYRDRPDVYIGANMFFYYEEGNPAAVFAPDVFVVFGVDKTERRTFKVWEEGKAPDVIFELTSRKTYRADLSDKRILYEELGVREYFLFDPLQEYLRPPLQGFRLHEDYYVPLTPLQLPDGIWQMESKVLKLILHAEAKQIRLYDPVQERYLLTRPEEAAARIRAQEELIEAQAEIARLRALLAEQSETDF